MLASSPVTAIFLNGTARLLILLIQYDHMVATYKIYTVHGVGYDQLLVIVISIIICKYALLVLVPPRPTCLTPKVNWRTTCMIIKGAELLRCMCLGREVPGPCKSAVQAAY